MATYIPSTGELVNLPAPADINAQMEELYGAPFVGFVLLTASAADGTEWWWPSGGGTSHLEVNERAQTWMVARGIQFTGDIRGPVLYLSSTEAEAARDPFPLASVAPGRGAEPPRARPPASKPAAPAERFPAPAWVRISGRTFPVKEKLKALGCHFDPKGAGAWYAPAAVAARAQKVVDDQ